MFFSFLPPPAWLGWAIFALYFGGHIVTFVLGRPEWTKYVLGAQLAVNAALVTRAAIVSPNPIDIAGVLIFTTLFFPVAAIGQLLAQASRRWIWQRTTQTAHGQHEI